MEAASGPVGTAPPKASSSRGRVWAWVAAIAAVILLAVLIWWLWRGRSGLGQLDGGQLFDSQDLPAEMMGPATMAAFRRGGQPLAVTSRAVGCPYEAATPATALRGRLFAQDASLADASTIREVQHPGEFAGQLNTPCGLRAAAGVNVFRSLMDGTPLPSGQAQPTCGWAQSQSDAGGCPQNFIHLGVNTWGVGNTMTQRNEQVPPMLVPTVGARPWPIPDDY